MSANADQQEFWTNTVGADWVALQAVMDASFQPVLDLVLESAGLAPRQSVLDIGCGAGTSTVQSADLVGAQGRVLGADISQTLLDRANLLAQDRAHVQFVHADAQTHAFERQAFDHMISRFGVMFFDDSTAAFVNIARALRPGAKITMACWGPAPDNPWFMLPAQEAQAHLGKPPKADRSLPGPFAFEDQGRVIALLQAAGLREVTATTHHILLTPPGDAEAFADQQSVIGPVNGIIAHFNGSDADRAAIRARIIVACARFETPQGLRVPANINLFEARA
jgi:SAM-dependent methyltransferase